MLDRPMWDSRLYVGRWVWVLTQRSYGRISGSGSLRALMLPPLANQAQNPRLITRQFSRFERRAA